MSDAECLYGRCLRSDPVADFSFCTKFCDCGKDSSCTDDDGAGWAFVCQRYDPEHWAAFPPICTQACDTVADCPPQYDACAVITGGRSVCTDSSARNP